MAKNDAAGVQTSKDLVLKMAHMAMMKHRGLPSDHIEAANMAGEIVQIAMKLKKLMDEDAEQYTNLPENVVTFPRLTAH